MKKNIISRFRRLKKEIKDLKTRPSLEFMGISWVVSPVSKVFYEMVQDDYEKNRKKEK